MIAEPYFRFLKLGALCAGLTAVWLVTRKSDLPSIESLKKQVESAHPEWVTSEKTIVYYYDDNPFLVDKPHSEVKSGIKEVLTKSDLDKSGFESIHYLGYDALLKDLDHPNGDLVRFKKEHQVLFCFQNESIYENDLFSFSLVKKSAQKIEIMAWPKDCRASNNQIYTIKHEPFQFKFQPMELISKRNLKQWNLRIKKQRLVLCEKSLWLLKEDRIEVVQTKAAFEKCLENSFIGEFFFVNQIQEKNGHLYIQGFHYNKGRTQKKQLEYTLKIKEEKKP